MNREQVMAQDAMLRKKGEFDGSFDMEATFPGKASLLDWESCLVGSRLPSSFARSAAAL